MQNLHIANILPEWIDAGLQVAEVLTGTKVVWQLGNTCSIQVRHTIKHPIKVYEANHSHSGCAVVICTKKPCKRERATAAVHV